MAAEARREARRRRILENAEARMGRILGTEGKSDPGLEDGSFRTTKSAAQALREFQAAGQSPVREAEEVTHTSPHKAYRPAGDKSSLRRSSKDRLDWGLALAAGLLLRLLWVPWSEASVLLPWGVVLGTAEAVRAGQGGKSPPRGPFVDVLLFAGLSQPLVNFGFTVGSAVWRAVSGTAVMLFGFLAAHLFLAAFPA